MTHPCNPWLHGSAVRDFSNKRPEDRFHLGTALKRRDAASPLGVETTDYTDWEARSGEAASLKRGSISPERSELRRRRYAGCVLTASQAKRKDRLGRPLLIGLEAHDCIAFHGRAGSMTPP